MTYDTLKFRELVKIARWDGIDQIELLAMLHEIDYDRSMELADKLPHDHLDWYHEKGGLWQRLNTELCPNIITIAGNKIKIPLEMRMEVFGKKLMINNLIKRIELSDNSELELLELMPTCISIAIVDRVECKFVSESIVPIAAQIELLPARIVYPIAMFFFRQLKTLTNTKQDDSKFQTTSKPRLVERLKTSWSRLVTKGSSGLAT